MIAATWVPEPYDKAGQHSPVEGSEGPDSWQVQGHSRIQEEGAQGHSRSSKEGIHGGRGAGILGIHAPKTK